MTDTKNTGVLLEAFCKKNGIKMGGNFLHFLVEVGKAASALHLKEEKVIEAVSAIVGKGHNPMYICPSCDSNVLVEYGACPTCGVELVEGGAEKADTFSSKKEVKASKDAGEVIREKIAERPKMVVPPSKEDIKKMKLVELIFVAQSFEIEIDSQGKLADVRKAVLEDLYGEEKVTIKDITKKKNIKIENVEEEEEQEIDDDEFEPEEEEEDEKPAKKASKKSSKKTSKKVEVEEEEEQDDEEEDDSDDDDIDEEEEELDEDDTDSDDEEEEDDSDDEEEEDNDDEEEELDEEEEDEKPAKKSSKKTSKKVEVEEDEEEEQDDDDSDDEEEEEEKPVKKSAKKVSENLDDAKSQRDKNKARLKELIVDFKANSKLVDKVEQKDLILILGMLGVKENVMKLDKKALAQKVKDVLKTKK